LSFIERDTILIFDKNEIMKTFPDYLLLLLLIIVAIGQPVFAQDKKAYYCPPCGGDCDQAAYSAPGVCANCGMTLVLENIAYHEQKAKAKHLKVLFYLQNGVEVLDFAGPMEVFSYAGFDVSVVSKTKSPIISQGILKIIPDYSIDDAPAADILAFFGGSTGNATNDTAVVQWLKNRAAPEYYFSVCTGAFILGKAGILDNLTVTTFHESIESLKNAVPKAKVLSNVRFVDNGKVMTTAGISAGIDGALQLVAKVRGKEAAAQIAKYMEYDKWVPDQGLVINKATGKP
jgi:putative intracellular protease/amidase